MTNSRNYSRLRKSDRFSSEAQKPRRTSYFVSKLVADVPTP